VSTNYVEQRDATYVVAGTRVSLDSIVHAFVSGACLPLKIEIE
jgi:hypothetical protein